MSVSMMLLGLAKQTHMYVHVCMYVCWYMWLRACFEFKICSYLHRSIRGIVQDLNDEPIRWPREPACGSNGKVINLHFKIQHPFIGSATVYSCSLSIQTAGVGSHEMDPIWYMGHWHELRSIQFVRCRCFLCIHEELNLYIVISMSTK